MLSNLPRGLKTPPDFATDPPIQPARTEHFAAKWNHLASHKCGKNNKLERQPGSVRAHAALRAGLLRPLPTCSRLQEKNMFDYFHVPGRTSVHERKLAAWALFVGERSRMVSSPDRSVRPHRGMLPDIDPATAVPDPNCRSIFRRLKDFFGAIGGPVEALEIGPARSLSGTPDAPVGKTASLAYSGEGESRPSAERSSAVEASDLDHSRAA
jgi:hypothetical protein